MDYQPKTNVVKDESGNLLLEFPISLNMWKVDCNQPLDMVGMMFGTPKLIQLSHWQLEPNSVEIKI
jgi:hypothetical protein